MSLLNKPIEEVIQTLYEGIKSKKILYQILRKNIN